MSVPVVTIIGRPNVGKSTLFNRIIKKREAIVDDQPGATRDRLYAETDWQGQSFMLVDTGGYMPQVLDEMEKAIREQVEIAIEEADVILYVTDQSTGVTDWDQDIASKLKKAEKKVILIVNKVDNQMMEAEIYQFFNLGLGEPLGVSALHGRAIGDMLDELVQKVRKVPEIPQAEDGIKLAVVGRENVGKSSFVNTLIGKARSIVTTIPGTTRDPIDSELNYQKRKYLLIDTAGLKRKTRVKENILFYSHLRTLRSIQRADVVLYFLDATDGPTRQDLRIVQEAAVQKKGLVVAVNKWDLIPKDEKTMNIWEKALREKLGIYSYIPIVFTSVLEKKRLYKLLDVATEVYQELQKVIPTHELNESLLPIMQTTSPPSVQGKEIKIKYITQVKSSPPVFAFFCNFPKLVMESYRRFLERKIRELWGFHGVPVTVVFKSKGKKRK
ncbi:MAG: ribosome biogenesis GTPase Der [Calditrichaeota bacterium]|nr:ribosome biogenesis GTPase Der [Calditrichota bacterium]RQV92570.1 MAG: ribosome biogenesis GTPase Der [bacterium]RQV99644.1 MAG: ribosome biogenesis GTPase Der [Calditrichota bacterium]